MDKWKYFEGFSLFRQRPDNTFEQLRIVGRDKIFRQYVVEKIFPIEGEREIELLKISKSKMENSEVFI